MNGKKVVAFGEMMMRLTTEGYSRFVQATGFDLVFGGSEANAAVSLCNYGTPAAFVTRLPAHALGDAAVNALRARGVETTSILRGGDRMGLYFVEKGTAYRPQGIVYDRANSAIAEAQSGDFDWEAIFEGADWFHFSGITPALSEGCAALCLEACQTAHRRGMTVSCDLNYRDKLWSREKAGRVMGELCRYVDVCLAYEDEPQDIFGIYPPDGASREDGYRAMAAALRERFGFSVVAITSSHAYSTMHIDWSAMLDDGQACYFSRRYELDAVDRIGGGDAFSGACIHALKAGLPPQDAIEFAAAAGCLKYTVEGDFHQVSFDEVARLAGIGR